MSGRRRQALSSRRLVAHSVVVVLVATVFSAWTLEPTGLGGAFLRGLVMFAWLLAVATCLGVGLWRRFRDVTAAALVWLAGLVLALVATAIVHGFVSETTQRRGDEIAAAIGRFEADVHRAPGTLDELVPTYLPEVPPTAYGLWTTHPFVYNQAGSRDGWSLAFEAGAATVCIRTGSRGWVCDD